MNKTKKILLIAPATEFGAYPPLGLISIASFIKEKGHDVKVIDYSGEDIEELKVKKDIENFNPDIVALGVLTGPGIKRAVMVSKIAKSLGKYVIWGGPSYNTA
ncbi:cobalamin-dependent protein [Candidatus Woesearchaeota archaeon]|nr:cobalamin-dependent protein [Candidatus Woesearchaeota archaeon]